MRILDLGCGSGYLSFPIAANHPGCEVTGLDIVSEALNADRRRAEKEGRDNLTFVNYDGMDFPFAPGTFDWIVTRYALHHFPDIEHSIEEIRKCLKKEADSLFQIHVPTTVTGKGSWTNICVLKKTDIYVFTRRVNGRKSAAGTDLSS